MFETCESVESLMFGCWADILEISNDHPMEISISVFPKGKIKISMGISRTALQGHPGRGPVWRYMAMMTVPQDSYGWYGRTWVEHGRKGTSLVTFSGLFGYSGSRGNYLGGLQEMSFKP